MRPQEHRAIRQDAQWKCIKLSETLRELRRTINEPIIALAEVDQLTREIENKASSIRKDVAAIEGNAGGTED